MLQRPVTLIPGPLCTAAPPQGKTPGPRGPAVWGSPRLWGGLAPQRPGQDGGLLGRSALSRQFQRIGRKRRETWGLKGVIPLVHVAVCLSRCLSEGLLG